ncbi:hypothetical protein [Amnibacterium sp.]|nr:hypothetical protein [Amnibacterium sp.]MCU1474292.1 hypothetical protein [Amnibacterium sp.]
MIRRLQFRLYRFLHGEDLFDAWPGDIRPTPTPAEAVTRRHHTPSAVAHH